MTASSYPISTTVDADTFMRLAELRIRRPSALGYAWVGAASPPNSVEFDPALSPDEEAMLADIISAAVPPPRLLRLLDIADIPSPCLLGRSPGGEGPIEVITIGEGLDLADGELSAPGGGGGGAPTNAKYITAAANGSLTAEVVIPGLAGSPDRAGVGGSTITEEYDSTSTGLTWSPSEPATVDSDTTIPSGLYIRSTDTTARHGMRSFAPAGNFDVRAHMGVGRETTSSYTELGLEVANADGSNRLYLMLAVNPATPQIYCNAFTFVSGSWTLRSASWPAATAMYARITRAGDTITWWISSTGQEGGWIPIASLSHAITVAAVGYYIEAGSGATPYTAYSDWLRA